jgi:hypothetical protein
MSSMVKAAGFDTVRGWKLADPASRMPRLRVGQQDLSAPAPLEGDVVVLLPGILE